MQRRQAGLGRLGEEVPEKEANQQIELVGWVTPEDQREDRHQHDEHRERLQQRPHEAAERAVVAGLEIGADERPDESRQRGELRAAHPAARADGIADLAQRIRREQRRGLSRFTHRAKWSRVSCARWCAEG